MIDLRLRPCSDEPNKKQILSLDLKHLEIILQRKKVSTLDLFIF